MTAQQMVAIECDECGERRELVGNATQARRELASELWRRRLRDGLWIDVCADCEAEIVATLGLEP